MVGTLFEDDIALTVSQAEEILHDASKNRRRKKRKLAANVDKRWALPIPYAFNGRHSKSFSINMYMIILHIIILPLWLETELLIFDLPHGLLTQPYKHDTQNPKRM